MKLKIGDFLKRRKDAVDVTDGVIYKRATIRINHKGISVRDELDGTQIKTKRQFIISKGQFLLSKIDARNGAFGIVPEELNNGIITGNFWTFDVDQSKVLIDFFKSFTETVSFTDICIRSSSGTTNRKYLDEKKFLDIDIEVPNIEEQAVAISNYYQRREFINSLQNSGVNQRETLANLRQSILQEAVQGKLTAKWRANNPNTEPASELLKRIEAEKQQLIAEKKIKKEKPLPPIGEDEIPCELPEGWVWCRLGKYAHYGALSKAENKDTKEDTWVLELEDIEKDSSRLLKKIRFNERDFKSTKSRFKVSDVVYGKLRPYLDKVIVADEAGVCTTEMIPIKSFSCSSPEYLRWFLKSKGFIKYANGSTHGMRMPRLGTDVAKQAIISIPPAEEQKIIVEKVNSLMVLCDELEQQIESSQIQIEQLMQSCLKEVFEYESN